jgi:hypothetical protein
MVANVRAHSHLAKQQALLMLVSVPVLLRLLVLPLAVVQKAADRWSTVRVNFYQVELAFFGKA